MSKFKNLLRTYLNIILKTYNIIQNNQKVKIYIVPYTFCI